MKLTQAVKKGGCAAKVAAQELQDILAKIDFPPPNKKLTINANHFDDATVYKLSNKRYLISTLDFFTPIVDSPKLFGKIAAANALSDVYAMGGKPIHGLSILAYPMISMGKDIIAEIIQGAVSVLKEAGADLAGGHTIDDETLKFGLSVTGLVDNDKLITNANAKPGDKLILTKALGTGTLMAALKSGIKKEEELSDAFQSMCLLNNLHCCLKSEDYPALHAMTDVTGFGLAGHGFQMAQASNVSITFNARRFPKLDCVEETLKKSCFTKAHKTNKEYVDEQLFIDDSVLSTNQSLFFDPQTSGGLLISVDPEQAETLVEKLRVYFPRTNVIGSVEEKREKSLYLVN
ncbi:MAG: selenide, water dikinase SelD [bacterium]